MNGPEIVAVDSVKSSLADRLPDLVRSPGVDHFVVVRSGQAVQGRFEADEVVVCAEAAEDAQTVVLVPRGWGRPQLGTVRGRHLFGEAGEPCHPARWQVAGHVVGVWRRREGVWVYDSCLQDDASQGPAMPHLAPAVPAPAAAANQVVRPSGGQLALFAA